MSSKEEPATLLDALSLITAGKVTVTVAGYPFLAVRSDDKEIDMDVGGAKMAGVSLSNLVRLQEDDKNVLMASERTAERLSRLRWKLTLYDRGSRILTMGSGVSRLTARVKVNPLKLRRLLEALR